MQITNAFMYSWAGAVADSGAEVIACILNPVNLGTIGKDSYPASIIGMDNVLENMAYALGRTQGLWPAQQQK